MRLFFLVSNDFKEKIVGYVVFNIFFVVCGKFFILGVVLFLLGYTKDFF